MATFFVDINYKNVNSGPSISATPLVFLNSLNVSIEDMLADDVVYK